VTGTVGSTGGRRTLWRRGRAGRRRRPGTWRFEPVVASAAAALTGQGGAGLAGDGGQPVRPGARVGGTDQAQGLVGVVGDHHVDLGGLVRSQVVRPTELGPPGLLPRACSCPRQPGATGWSPDACASPCGLLAVLEDYAVHYNQHRPHRALKLRPPRCDEITPAAETTIAGLTIAEIRRHGVLGGLINQYEGAA